MPKKSTDTQAYEKEIFSVEKGILRATEDMYWEYLEDFDAACTRLLTSRRGKLEVDLTEVIFISSSFLGCLNNLVIQAARLKKHVVLKVNQDISWLFELMGSRKNMDMQVL